MFWNKSRAHKAAADAAVAAEGVRDLWIGHVPASRSQGGPSVIPARTNQELLVEEATVAAKAKGEPVRCSATLGRGHRCSRMGVNGRTLCPSHLAMGWSSKDEFTESTRAVQPTH